MSSSVQHGPEDIFKACEEAEKPIGIHRNILQHKDIVESNFKLMQLYSPSISSIHKKQINFALQEFDKSYNKMEILKKMASDGIDAGKFNVLFFSLKNITK